MAFPAAADDLIAMRLAGGVWLSVAAVAAFGLDPQTAITQYMQDAFQTRHGLPQDTVQAITQTRDGYLWVGTRHGLARFDGVRFTVFNSRLNPELRESAIRALAAGRDGALWIGTSGGGLTRYQDGRFTTYTANE